MEIIWHGFSCFTVNGKSGSLVIDPYDVKTAGIKLPKLSADICLANAEFPFHHAVAEAGKFSCVFDWPGEYESKGIIIQAMTAFDRPREKDEASKKDVANPVLVYMMKLDGFKLCHLSNIGHKLTPEMLETIGNVDILMIPIGGLNCLDAKKAHEVIEQLDPRIVIPMYYKLPGVKLPLAELEIFLKEVGVHSPVKEKSLKYQATSNLPQEQMEFKILEPELG